MIHLDTAQKVPLKRTRFEWWVSKDCCEEMERRKGRWEDAADTEPLKGQATESALSLVPQNNRMLFKRHRITDFKTRCFPVTKRKMAGRKFPQNSNLNKFICRRKTLNIRSSLTHNDPTTVTTCSGRTPTPFAGKSVWSNSWTFIKTHKAIELLHNIQWPWCSNKNTISSTNCCVSYSYNTNNLGPFL